MATREIPKQVYRVCDRCGSDEEEEKQNWYNERSEVRVSWIGRALDGGGAGYTTSYDLCGRCTKELSKWIKP